MEIEKKMLTKKKAIILIFMKFYFNILFDIILDLKKFKLKKI